MRLHLGRPTALAGGLDLFPIWSDGHGRRRYTTSHERLHVRELPEPRVDAVQVSNHGSQDVLVIDGQLFEAGLQHRMVSATRLVRAGATVTLDVCGVESGRWGGPDHAQVSRGRRATEFVRCVHADQQQVWQRIAETTRSADVDPSETGSHVEHGRSADARWQRATRRLRPLRGQCGVLGAVGGVPLRVEVFDSPTSLDEQLGAIVTALGRDADLAADRGPEPDPYVDPEWATEAQARRLVEYLEVDIRELRHRPGDDLTRTGPFVHNDATMLRQGHHVVHLRSTNRAHPYWF